MAVTERLKVNLVQGENRMQTVVRGQIEVPEPKPSVEKILSKETTVKVRDVNVVPDKVIINGTLILQVVYVAFEVAQSVHSMSGEINFTTFVDVAGAEPGMDYDVDFTLEDVSMTPSNDNACAFDVVAVLSTYAKLMDVAELEVLVETPSGNEALETQDVTVEHMVGERVTKQVIVGDVFYMPENKPAIERVLKAKARADLIDKRVLSGKVVVDGEISIEVLYSSLTPAQSVHDLHRTFKFSDFLEVPEAQQGMNVHVRAEVESATIEASNCPKVAADVIVRLTAYVSETRTLRDIPTELANEAGYERVTLKIDRTIGTGQTQIIFRETTELPHFKPGVMRVLESRIDQEQTKVTEANILDGKVLINGHTVVEVVYVSMEPDQAVHALHQRLNFRTFVAVPEAEHGMRSNVKIFPEYVNVDQEDCDLHTEAVLKVEVTVTDLSQISVYVPTEEVEVAPTTTVCVPTEYTVRAGDTLNRIAEEHGTTVAMILAENPQITNPDELEVGQVIMIPCVPLG